MKKILALIVHVLVIGKNNRSSFDREKNVLYTIDTVLDFSAIFGENENGYAYLTIKGAKILARLARANIINEIAANFEIDTTVSNNIGVCGEFTALKILGATKASRDDDRNGIDGWLYDIPIQIKCCNHGIIEKIQYMDTDVKRYGISVINASIQDLYNIVNG